MIDPAPSRVHTNTDTGFESFYRTETKPLVAFLMMQGARLADAADIAQDTMAAAYRRWHDIDHPRAWAYKVASRALVRRLSTVETPVSEPAETTPLLCDTDIEAWEQRHDVSRILAVLTPRQRQIMAWTLSGYTPTEIAAELSLTPEAVRTTLLRARRALRTHLAGKEADQ